MSSNSDSKKFGCCIILTLLLLTFVFSICIFWEFNNVDSSSLKLVGIVAEVVLTEDCNKLFIAVDALFAGNETIFGCWLLLIIDGFDCITDDICFVAFVVVNVVLLGLANVIIFGLFTLLIVCVVDFCDSPFNI